MNFQELMQKQQQERQKQTDIHTAQWEAFHSHFRDETKRNGYMPELDAKKDAQEKLIAKRHHDELDRLTATQMKEAEDWGKVHDVIGKLESNSRWLEELERNPDRKNVMRKIQEEDWAKQDAEKKWAEEQEAANERQWQILREVNQEGQQNDQQQENPKDTKPEKSHEEPKEIYISTEQWNELIHQLKRSTKTITSRGNGKKREPTVEKASSELQKAQANEKAKLKEPKQKQMQAGKKNENVLSTEEIAKIQKELSENFQQMMQREKGRDVGWE